MKTLASSVLALSLLAFVPSAHAGDVLVYQCNQILEGNQVGNAVTTVASGQITLSRDSNPPATESKSPVVDVQIQLVDSSGNPVHLLPYDGFTGAVDASVVSNKCYDLGPLAENAQSLSINTECLNETGEGRDWYRSKQSLRLNKQTNQVQFSETLRTCNDDFFGQCDLGSFVPQVSVEMSCQPVAAAQ